MRLCVAAPIASQDLASRLHSGRADLPAGYAGAPLTAVLIGALLDRGHQVTAITLDYDLPQGSRAVHARGDGLDLHVLPGRRRAWSPNGWRPGRALDLFAVERHQVEREIRQSGAELVHAHWTYEFAMAALASRLPHVITAHDSPRRVWRHSRNAYRLVRWWMAMQVLRKARVVTAVSDYMANEIADMTKAPIKVVPNPVADSAWRLARPHALRSPAQLGMVCNGWSDLKNPQVALQAFGILQQRLPRAQLSLFGRDFEPGGLGQRWAHSHGLCEGLRFVGLLSHTELLSELSTLDLLLHPALEESFGVAVAEAMAMGLPVVGGQCSGAVPWVVGDGGVMVDARSPEAMARAAVLILSDPVRHASLSTCARTRVASNFTADRVVEAYLAIYRETIADWPDEPADWSNRP